jgi:hypothetical protein
VGASAATLAGAVAGGLRVVLDMVSILGVAGQ